MSPARSARLFGAPPGWIDLPNSGRPWMVRAGRNLELHDAGRPCHCHSYHALVITVVAGFHRCLRGRHISVLAIGARFGRYERSEQRIDVDDLKGSVVMDL